MELKIITSVRYKHIPKNVQNPPAMSRLYNSRYCEPQMIYSCLENDIFSLMHCIMHQWLFFPCAPVENNRAFVDQKITESAATSNRRSKKRKGKKDLLAPGKGRAHKQLREDERRERGGLLAAVREAIRRPHFRLYSWSGGCTSGEGTAGGELPDERTITSWVDERKSRGHMLVTWHTIVDDGEAVAIEWIAALFLLGSKVGQKMVSQTSAALPFVALQHLLIVRVANASHFLHFLESEM